MVWGSVHLVIMGGKGGSNLTGLLRVYRCLSGLKEFSLS